MEKFKFKRFKVHHNERDYYILIPENINQLWVIDWADDWYGGCFISGSAKSLRSLIAGYGVLAFNPYVIVYLPIRNNDIPASLNYHDNGIYDMVFCTNRIQLNLNEWKAIRQKLLKTQWTRYKFDFNIERMQSYFKNGLDDLRKISHEKLLKKAGANIELFANTAFFSFPQIYYQYNAIDMYETFFKDFENDDMSYCYDSQKDGWTCYDHSYFVYHGVNRGKYTYERPSVCFQLELYDVGIINKYRKKKEEFVKRRSAKDASSDIWRKYLSYPILEISLTTKKKKEQIEVKVKGGDLTNGLKNNSAE